MKISAIINAKNEEAKIKACLQSLSFCDEIVVIDTGSSDKTAEIAKSMNAKVYQYETDDFSKMKMFGLQKAQHPWVFYIDADERVSDSLRASIQAAIKHSMHVAYEVVRQNYYYGDVAWPKKEKFLRLFQKKHLQNWVGKLHETAVVDGLAGELTGDLLHYTHQDISSMVKKTISWSKIEAQLRFDAHHPKMEWWRFPSVMIRAFLRTYLNDGGWRTGTAGFVEACFQAFSAFITYARLWELQKNET